MALTAIEKETIIIYNEKEHTAEVQTYHRKLKRILREIDAENPGLCVISENGAFMEAIIPKRLVSIRKPRKKAGNTDENMVTEGELE